MTLFTRRLARAVLLSATVLTGAANDFGGDSADGQSHFAPNGAFGAFLAGRFAGQHADLDIASDRLEAALTRDPGLPELAGPAFMAATMAGRPDAVRLAAALPADPLAQLVVADHDARAGHWEQAEARFAALPASGLTEALRPLLVAWAQQGGGRTDAALATLVPLLDGPRFTAVYALHAALIADLGGRNEEAARLYRAAQTGYGAPNLRVGVILASFEARQGAAEDARRTLRSLAAANGDLAIARQGLEAAAAEPAVRTALDGIAEAYLALAATLRQQNQPEAARVMMRLALDMRPDFTAAQLLLADAQEAAKRADAALATLAQVPDADPLAPVVRLRQASLLEAAGQSQEATRMLEALAAQHPDRPEPLAQQGDVLRRKGRFTEAAAAYDAAIARLGTPTRANWPLFYERGIAFERAGQWPQAEADFEYALRLAPEQPHVLNYLGYAWTERGENVERARGMIERAAAQLPNDGAIVDSLGWVKLRQGDAAGALVHLERAVELQPEDSVINAHLGDALAAVGRVREAAFQWRRALNLKPEPEDAGRIAAKLAALPEGEPPAVVAAPSRPVP